jgi:spermidine synthase
MRDSVRISPLRVCILAFIVGAVGAICQVSVIRESIWLLGGSELSIGAVLALWLAGSALGSALISRPLAKKSTQSYISLFLLLPFLFLLQLLLAREVRAALSPISGTLISFTDSLLLVALLSIPLSATCGALFALACRLTNAADSGSVTKIYVFESAGAAAGAALFAFLLVPFSPVTVCALIGIFSSFALFYLAGREVSRLFAALSLIALSLWVAVQAPGTLKSLDRRTREDSLGVRSIRYVGETKSGNITVAQSPGGANMFISGTLVVSNQPAAEEIVHTALLSHSAPEKVLLIGGVLQGLVCEIVKHPVSKITCVESDPQSVVRIIPYLPQHIVDCLKSPRVRVIQTDARRLVGRSATYDCIIIALGEPSTGLLNRFFTVEFFREAYESLTEDGIILVNLPLSPGRVPQELLQMIAAVKKSLESVFPSVTLISADKAGTLILAGKNANFQVSAETMTARLGERKIETSWLTPEVLVDNASGFRTAQVRSQVNALGGVPANRDLKPLSYLYSLLLWQKRTGSAESLLFMRGVSVKELSLFAAALFGLFCVFVWRFGSSRLASGAGVATVGFSSLSFQMLVLLAFQSICGNLYEACALFLSLFMLGLLAGSLSGRRWLAVDSRRALLLYLLLLCGALYLFLVPGFLSFAGHLYHSSALVTTYLLFPLSSAVCGFITGVVFPAANSLYLRGIPDNSKRGRSAPMIYALDLFGAGLGAFFTTFYFVPVIGVAGSLYFLSFLLLLAAFPCAVLIFPFTRRETG